jgi:hypothetical protein
VCWCRENQYDKEEKPPKTVLEKVVAVIKTQNTPGGSSRQAISKGYKDKFGEML